MVGTIPPELAQLGHLQVLDLSHNQLTGAIPPELAQLGHLQVLDLSFNRLTGSIPPELGQLGHLQSLDLRSNGLTGTIPPTLGRLGQLEWLHLDHNRLTGSIPPELGQLGHLQVLDLSFNRLTGCIPMSLEHLLQVRELNLTGNRLTDTTPPAREQFNQSGIPPVAGVYTDQAAHWGGQYRVRREGRQVTATLAVHRAPVGHGAPPQPLFRLPEGYRPPWPMTWTTAARPMTARGRPLPEATAVTLILEARPDGTVHHLDAPTPRQRGVCGVPHHHHLDDGGDGSTPHGGNVHAGGGCGNLPPGASGEHRHGDPGFATRGWIGCRTVPRTCSRSRRASGR